MNVNYSAKNYYAVFVTHHLYYIPQFIPIAKELIKRKKSILFLLLGLDAPEQNEIAGNYLEKNGFPYRFYSKTEPSTSCIFMINSANSFPEINIDYKYSALVLHGIGTKAGHFTEDKNVYDIRFVEGQFRVDKIKELYPDVKSKLYNVGFAKLDEAFAVNEMDKKDLMNMMGVDLSKRTILYAPTFYPSSIDMMPDNFPEYFKEYNIILKPHFFSFTKKQYRKHVKKFNIWSNYNNFYLAGIEEFNLVPFMSVADIIISDESSAIFEFAALNKPVVVNRNVKFRLTYRLFKSKIRKRMDSNMDMFKEVGVPVYDFKELYPTVVYELEHPENKETNRKEICEQIVGTVDGKVSKRIADVMDSLA